MLRHFRSVVFVILLAGGVATSALTMPTAQAATDEAPSSGAVGTQVTQVAQVTTDMATDYWTKERMLSAKPAPVPKVDVATNANLTASAGPQGKPGKVDAAVPTARLSASSAPLALDASAAAPWTGPTGSAPATTSGKVFFVKADGGDYVCSGSTVNSKGKNLVLTAGHCVSDGAGTWYNSAPWIFVPGYANGDAPYGRWTAREIWTRPAWHNGGDRAEDIGAAVMLADAGGTSIVDSVGGQGIEWNYPLSQFQYQFGYPQRAPFDGRSLQYCTGQSYDDGGHNGINCDMTEGASGGPWLDDFDGELGFVDSVNSWVFWDDDTGVRYMWNGPYFGNNARDFYNTIADL